MIEIALAHIYQVHFTYRGKRRTGRFTNIESVIAAIAWWMIHAKYEIAKPSALCTCRADELDTHCPVHNGRYEYYIKLHERLARRIGEPLRERIEVNNG